MKKALFVLSTVLVTSSFSGAYATETQCKKHHKKHRHCAATVAAKDTPKDLPKDAIVAEPAPAPSWMDNLSGSLAFNNNYVFRGVSQTQNMPSVQGGITYTFPIGIYLNLWGSNVRFPDTNAQIELDTIVGLRRTVGEDFAYDLNLARYNYPGARLLNYNEANTLFNYKFLQFGVSYSANVYNTHGSGTYYQGGINYGIPSEYLFGVNDVTFIALMGHYSLPRRAGNSYNDYSVSLSKKLNKTYTISAQWTNTNGRLHNSPYDGNQYIAQVAAAF